MSSIRKDTLYIVTGIPALNLGKFTSAMICETGHSTSVIMGYTIKAQLK